MTHSTKVLLVMVAFITLGIYCMATSGCSKRQTVTNETKTLYTGSEVEMVKDGESWRGKMNKGFVVFFDYDKHELKPEARRILKTNAEVMRQEIEHSQAGLFGPIFIIEGHCDERGTLEYNIALGQARAEAVKGYYVSLGIDPGMMETISYGEERPISGLYNQNRRVEISIK